MKHGGRPCNCRTGIQTSTTLINGLSIAIVPVSFWRSAATVGGRQWYTSACRIGSSACLQRCCLRFGYSDIESKNCNAVCAAVDTIFEQRPNDVRNAASFQRSRDCNDIYSAVLSRSRRNRLPFTYSTNNPANTARQAPFQTNNHQGCHQAPVCASTQSEPPNARNVTNPIRHNPLTRPRIRTA